MDFLIAFLTFFYFDSRFFLWDINQIPSFCFSFFDSRSWFFSCNFCFSLLNRRFDFFNYFWCLSYLSNFTWRNFTSFISRNLSKLCKSKEDSHRCQSNFHFTKRKTFLLKHSFCHNDLFSLTDLIFF